MLKRITDGLAITTGGKTMMNKYVVYSCVVGGYDEIHQPLITDERFDYILFSDSKSDDSVGIWQIRDIPYSNADSRLSSRYVKCLVTEVLSEYEASLYIDANVRITSSWVYDRFIELIGRKVGWAGIFHPDQHCIYDEMCAITHLRWVHDYDVVVWYGQMKREGYPEDNGLFENNVIFRRHTSDVADAGRLWWKTLEDGCKRDQFSLMYVLWKINLKTDYFLPENECPRLGSSDFAYYPHKSHNRVKNLNFLEMMRYRINRTKYPENVRRGYHEMFDWTSRFRNPRKGLILWEVLSFFRWAPRMVSNSVRSRV